MDSSQPTLSGKPLVPSEKHDLLYSKARYVLNQRHIKRPWFNLNPFLERTDETVDLENYLPEESKYIQPLESLVLCESFNSEYPTDTREILLETFFDYLNSDEWEDGCSIRVMEGQLLTQVLIGLYRLENEGKTIRHTTYAFAKNHRPRNGCYKLADKESYGATKENLLVEFAYFGHLSKDKPNVQTQKPLEYLRLGISDQPEQDDMQPPIVSPATLPDVMGKRRGRSLSVNTDALMRPLAIGPLPTPQQGETAKLTGNWGRRGSVMLKPMTAIRAMKAFQPGTRRQSMAGPAPAPVPILQAPPSFLKPLQEKRRESAPEARFRRRKEGGSTTGKGKKSAVPLKLLPEYDEDFSCTETEKEDDEEKIEEEERDNFFGEEFLLSESKPSTLPRLPEDVVSKLKRNKLELQRRREKAHKHKQEMSKALKRSGIPELPPIENFQDTNHVVMHQTVKMPDEVPTFEEFVKLLKEDEYYDPRFRNKVRMKSRKIAQRYYKAKGRRRSTAILSIDDMPSFGGSAMGMRHTKRSSTTNYRSSLETDSRQSIRLPTLRETNKRGHKNNKIIHENESNEQDDQPPSRDMNAFSNEVLGITDSFPCREHCLSNGGSFQKPENQSKTRTSTSDLAGTSSTAAKPEGNAENEGRTMARRPSMAVTSVPSPHLFASRVARMSPPRSPLPQMFPKVVANDDDNDSIESSSGDSETDEEETEPVFDTNKLNIRYSVERLRKKRKSRAAKKKPVFYDILAKYYRMQEAIQNFNKGTISKEKKSAQGRARRMGLGFFKANLVEQPKQEPMVIGKMKKFSFLDTSPNKRRLNMDRLPKVDFSVPCLETFHENLKRSLDNFVVRREIVISDVQTFFKSATSVTFTKKSCFQNEHKQHDANVEK